MVNYIQIPDLLYFILPFLCKKCINVYISRVKLYRGSKLVVWGASFLGSNVVTCHLKTNRDLGVLQQAEPTKTLKKTRNAIMFDRRRTIDELEALTGVS